MRAVMAEALGILAGGGLEKLLAGEIPSQALVLTYADFAALRPRYGASSWRVIMGKLIERRWVIRTYRNGLTAFQLTRQGWEAFKALYSVFSVRSEREWMLALYQPASQEKSASGAKASTASAARLLLTQAGFASLQAGVAIRPQAAYSDYLPQELRRLGYQAVFLPINAAAARPIPLGEMFQRGERPRHLSRLGEKISSNTETLLTELSSKKRLKNQTKERIGSVAVSGLDYFRQLLWPDLEVGGQAAQIQKLAVSLDRLLQEYAAINYAWRD